MQGNRHGDKISGRGRQLPLYFKRFAAGRGAEGHPQRARGVHGRAGNVPDGPCRICPRQRRVRPRDGAFTALLRPKTGGRADDPPKNDGAVSAVSAGGRYAGGGGMLSAHPQFVRGRAGAAVDFDAVQKGYCPLRPAGKAVSGRYF